MAMLWSHFLLLGPPLLLLLVANGAPVITRWWLDRRYSWPLDGGLLFFDGRPLLGPTKSWRGVVAAFLATSLCALLLGFSGWLGVQFALLAMVGDVLGSFIKRRLSIAPQGRASGLDQIPEALLPLWLLHDALSLGLAQILLLVAIFMLLEMALSPLLYRLHIRLRPY